MSEIKIKHKKEINEALIIRAIGCFLIFTFALFTICIFVFAFSGISIFKLFFIFPICAIPLSILYAYIVEKLGSNLGGRLFFWTSKEISLREQLSADLEKARHSKRNDRFEESLEILDDVLSKDGKFPDALFLKAQILWDRYERSIESKNLFRKVMELVSADNPLYRWSSYYIDKITEKDKMKVDEFMSNDR